MKDEEGSGRVKDFHPSAFILHPLFGFLVTSVLSATTTELLKLQTLSCCFLILSRRVIPTLAFTTLKNNVIARHNPTSLLMYFELCSLFLVLGILRLKPRCSVSVLTKFASYQAQSTKHQVQISDLKSQNQTSDYQFRWNLKSEI